MNRPKIVCLCGSTRFKDTFERVNAECTLKGQIVLSVGVFDAEEKDKPALDELHLSKIKMADYVYVLNVGGYIGRSTQGEIAYALMVGKPVLYLEVKKS